MLLPVVVRGLRRTGLVGVEEEKCLLTLSVPLLVHCSLKGAWKAIKQASERMAECVEYVPMRTDACMRANFA